MTDTLRLYELGPSPNSMKARIALKYKGLAYERIAVDPSDRATVIAVSGQPLTPVLTHGERVVFDSGAILRYLEANFRATPRLFTSDYPTMKAIERWEQASRGEIGAPVGIVFGLMFAGKSDPAEAARASEMLHRATAPIEERLAAGRWLVGETMTAADVVTAPFVYYGTLDAPSSGDRVRGFFAAQLQIGAGRERTREWVARVMAYDV
jgi:glutathione S-transferase